MGMPILGKRKLYYKQNNSLSVHTLSTAQLIAGVDEAGRGPLAGPVLAAAVILDPKKPILGLADSKLLTARKREELYQIITQQALAFAIGRAEVLEIEQINILQASLLAMQRAVNALTVSPERVLVDGLHCPKLPYPVHAIIKGDQIVGAISAASIIAKVTRDREMIELDARYPGYGFAVHKGYPTKGHLAALKKLGVCPIHRQLFAPVRRVILEFAR